MTNKYKKYLKSPEWAEIKIELLSQRGHKCEYCGKETKRLDVHHLHYRNIFNEEPEDLVLLCRTCHNKEHPKKQKTLAEKVEERKKKKKRNKNSLRYLEARYKRQQRKKKKALKSK